MTCSFEFDALDVGEKAGKREKVMSACESR